MPKVVPPGTGPYTSSIAFFNEGGGPAVETDAPQWSSSDPTIATAVAIPATPQKATIALAGPLGQTQINAAFPGHPTPYTVSEQLVVAQIAPQPVDTFVFLGNAAQTLVDQDGKPYAPSAFFNRPCVMDNGDIITLWDAPADPTKSGVWIFGYGTNQWTNPDLAIFGTFPPQWPRDANGRPLFRWENNLSDWDESTRSAFWSTPTPTDFPAQDDVRFVRSSNSFVTFPGGLAGGDQGGGVWNGTAYMFGFVSGRFNQIQSRALPDGHVVTWNDANIPTMGGPNNLSGAPFGTVRHGIDHRTGIAWCFNNSNELWMRNLASGPSDPIGWYRLPIVGPWPSNGASYTLCEHLDLMVAYTGDTVAQSGDGAFGTDPSTTYILDLATLVSRVGPKPPATVPTAVPQTSCSFLYDRFNRELKYIVTAGLYVWRFDLATSLL